MWTGNVSQELSESITTMVTNCNVQNRTRAQPPPGVLKPFPPGTHNSQLFPPPGVDGLPAITSTFSNMALGPPTSSSFGINIGQNALSANAVAPGSPGKLFPGISMMDSGKLISKFKLKT